MIFSRSNEDVVIRWVWVVAMCIWFLGLFVGLSLYGVGREPSYSSVFLVALTFLAVGIMKLAVDSLGSRIAGLKGEYKIGILLQDMWSSGVRPVHDIVLEKGNIDHVAVTRAGVWTIETKYTSGKIDVADGRLSRNGKLIPKNHLHQAYAEARAISRYLGNKGFPKIPVKPVLVFAGSCARVRFGLRPINGVVVVGSSYLKKILTGSTSEVLSIAEVEKVYGLLKQVTREEGPC